MTQDMLDSMNAPEAQALKACQSLKSADLCNAGLANNCPTPTPAPEPAPAPGPSSTEPGPPAPEVDAESTPAPTTKHKGVVADHAESMGAQCVVALVVLGMIEVVQ